METREKQIKTAIRVLKKGGAIVYPTDTVYGLGVDATNIEAVNRSNEMKNRKNQPVLMIVSDIEMAEEYVIFSDMAKKIFEKFMPGQVTLVLPLKKFVSDSIEILSAGTGTLGIRIPNNQTAVELVEKLGKPITSTSANLRGEVVCYSTDDCREQFEKNVHDLRPDFYFDEGILKSTPPSTIVIIIRNKIEIIREGLITRKEIFSALKVKQWVLRDDPDATLNLDAINARMAPDELYYEVGRNPQQFIKGR